MFSLKKHPYNLLLLTAILLFPVSFFTADNTLDIHLHDTFIILNLKQSLWIFIIVLLLFWLLNLFSKHFLFSKLLTRLHVVFLAVASLALVVISFYAKNYYNGLGGMPRRYYDYGSWNNIIRYANLSNIILITVLVFVLGMLMYLVNLIIGVFKKLILHKKLQ